ncbi:alpha/beta fold hydrolase [Pendulispora albinea]|uniref:Alpha/beta fold hydrolase n=1 Tax=Pendulispora albinea TaxID=2741071 RepID=A0ABZ2LQB1_9BACT
MDLHWAEMGRGRPLVLLHGLSDCHTTWSRVAPRLAKNRRVIMPDLPGHGFSGRPPEAYDLDWYAETMAKWIRSLGLDEFDLVGHSFGGGIAQRLLLECGSQVGRLALVASGGLGREVGLPLRFFASSGLVERFGQPFMGPGTRVVLKYFDIHDPGEAANLAWLNAQPGSARVLSRTARGVMDWRGQTRHFLDRAHELRQLPPTIVFWGDRDWIVPSQHASGVLDYLEGLYVVQFAGCGHFPHRECAQAFAISLEAFLDAAHHEPPRLRHAGLLPPSSLRRPSFLARSSARLRAVWDRVAAVFGLRRPRLA